MTADTTTCPCPACDDKRSAESDLLMCLRDAREAFLDARLGDLAGILTGDICAEAIEQVAS